ncbi:hypothetical protein PR002_g7845 [Phytophthora rubi]|nr:hypothetical protein PR002_g7845 [Phytophthora rubi]
MSMPISELEKITISFTTASTSFTGMITAWFNSRYLGRGMGEETQVQVEDLITAWNGPEDDDATAVELVQYFGVNRVGSQEAHLIEARLTVLAY